MKAMSDNDLKILQLIRRNPGLTKSELAKKIQLPWSTAYASISNLGNKINVYNENEANITGTSYRAGVYINPMYEYYVGISVGSSQLKIVLLGFDFCVPILTSFNDDITKSLYCFSDLLLKLGFKIDNDDYCKWCKTTPDNIPELSNILISICEGLLQLKKDNLNICAITFTLPGHIDFYKQEIISTSHLCKETDYIKNASITRLITTNIYDSLNKLCINVYVDHNVKSSAIAEKEHRFIVQKDNEDLINIYLGRGVGMSMIINGTLHRDKDNFAGQFGEVHTSYKSDIRKLGEFIRSDYIFKGCEKYNTKQLKEYLLENDPSKKECLIEVLAQALSDVIFVVGIKDIIFSGKFDKILDCIELDLTSKLEDLGIHGIQLYHSHYGEFSAAIGAAMGCFYNRYGIDYSWK